MMELIRFTGRLRQMADRMLRSVPLLERALHRGFEHLPESLQTRLRNERLRMRCENGWRLVPEAELTRKYIESLRWIIERDGRDAVGDYLEFGVFRGTSMTCFWRAVNEVGLDHIRLFGFDSFAGLPETARQDDGGYWKPGNYAADYEEARLNLSRAGVDWNRVFLVPGWFSDTLTPDLAREHEIAKAGVIMVDCDLYSSAIQALQFCTPLIQRTAVIHFDDWHSGGLAEKNMGEKRALDEFLAANPHLASEEFGSHGENSKVFKVQSELAPDGSRPRVWPFPRVCA